MEIAKEPDNIYKHGITLDKQKKRVKCNYCDKVMSGFNRLKYHLGGVPGQVVPCEKVPDKVKAVMRGWLLKRKEHNMCRGSIPLFDSNLIPECDLTFKFTEHNFGHPESSQSTAPRKRKKVGDTNSEQDETESGNNPFSLVKDETVYECVREDDPSRNFLRCIGRFFYDADIDFGAAMSPYFQKMLEAAIKHGQGCKVPSYEELRGWILQEELKEIQEHVKTVKHSWENTGCSILVDSWTDEKGRSFINFLADCSLGTVFLKSVDASDSMGDVDKLFMLFDGIIEEVGDHNVVQIITYDASGIMKGVGEKIKEKHRSVFWNLCSSHCISLMLGEVGKMAHVMKVLNKAKTLTKFMYSDRSLLELMKNHTGGRDIVRPSKMEALTSFLTLEEIVSQKTNLRNMFDSSRWRTSIWASTKEGKKVANLVQEPTFWADAEDVLNAITPLVCVIQLINGSDKPPMGYIYETMDQVKEKIKKNLKDIRAKYLPFWNFIDEIWDNQLHSPLHSAGYFLNPSLFYSTDFVADAEVASGLLCCIVRMIEDKESQDLIVVQLEKYRAALEGFGEKMAKEQKRKVPPALWWSSYGGHCPELQKLAIRILSQPCAGAMRFNLKRDLSEKLHTDARNDIEQQRLINQVFVHYNLRLKDFPSVLNEPKVMFLPEDIDSIADWVVNKQELNVDYENTSSTPKDVIMQQDSNKMKEEE